MQAHTDTRTDSVPKEALCQWWTKAVWGIIFIYMIHAHDSCREAMEELVDRGLVRHLGVSNFSVKQVEELLECARIKPVANQVELHPFLPQRKLVGVCARKVMINDFGESIICTKRGDSESTETPN